MSIEALISEVKELADECVMKYGFECLEMSDGLLTAYLVSLFPQQHLDLFYWNQYKLLRIFRERAKESIEWLNNK